MRAGKNDQPTLSWKVWESEGPRLGKERVLARSGGRVRKLRAIEDRPGHPLREIWNGERQAVKDRLAVPLRAKVGK
jgi:hypothetical protein